MQAGTCGSMAHEQKQYLRFDAHHSPTASVAASSPPLAASHHTPHHQALRTPPLIQSAESLGRGPFIRFNFVNGCALGFCTTWSEVEEATVGPVRIIKNNMGKQQRQSQTQQQLCVCLCVVQQQQQLWVSGAAAAAAADMACC